ncbi:uncharacterized protein TNCT_433441 [Trichonephila clavata]|uniref:Uncharacterized protein n=1 Tax=Trichonephila clavata TaxID=2740835 RepID=A0A8X6GDQ3_TRICU|nr:uncharacterized protein TNCT_433441 [Trichonephila clavata]
MEYIAVIPKSKSDANVKEFEKIEIYVNQEILPEDKILNDLSPSIHLISLFGIFPQDKNSDKKISQCHRFLSRTVQNIIHVFWLHILIVAFLLVIPIARPLQSNFTLNLMDIVIAIIRFVFHLKKDKIYSTIRSIENFYSSVTNDTYKPMKNSLITLFCGCLLASLAMAIPSLEHLRVAGVMEDYSKNYMFGLNITKDESEFFYILPTVIATIVVFCHHFVPMTSCIFICSIYLTFKKSIDKFEEKIKTDRLMKNVNINTYTALYNRMIEVLADVEDLLSASTFFLYGCLLTNQLCVLTQIIANGGMLTHPASITMQALVSIKNTVIFYSITWIGSSVTIAMSNVGRQLKCMTVDSRHDFEKLSLLLQNACSTSPSLTAWQMFRLRKNLILTMSSVMISYGMLLVQFTNQNK